MLKGARDSMRTAFRINSHLESSDPQYAKGVEHANEVAFILRQNVVQGKQMEEGGDRYSTWILARHVWSIPLGIAMEDGRFSPGLQEIEDYG